MSKIKLLVEIDEEDYGDFCDWFESVPSSVDGLPCVKGKFNTALYDAKPVDTSGDLIRREDLKKAIASYEREFAPDWVLNLIDNASTLELNSEYGAIQYSNGFNDGFTAAKDTIILNIAKQYIEHNELVPIWLSIGDIKGGEEK